MSVTLPLIAERYRLVRPLGEGGMGRVWLARDEVLHRDVAIKEVVPPPGLSATEQEEMHRRTLREARTAARLTHPNVVRMYDVVQTTQHPWIVMEYVPSRSLHQVISENGPITPQRAAEIGLGVLAALRAAHRAGVLHRDVKPGNVLLTEDGRVVLTDFGLAILEGEASVTRPGLVLGSPAYISPERARDGHGGPESDLWSLGATLYAAVEGQSPFARSSAMATLTALATEDPPPAPHAGPLRPVIDGLLRKDPAKRIGAAETERLLRRAAQGGRLASRLRRSSKTRVLPAGVAVAGWPEAGQAIGAAAVGAAAAAAPGMVAAPAEPVSPAVGGAPVQAAPTVADDLEPEAAPPGRPTGWAPVTVRSENAAGNRRWRWAVLLAAALAALVIVALVLGQPDPGTHRSGGNAASAGPSPTAGGASSAAPTPGPTQGGGQPTPPALPAGWQMYHDSTGFTVAAPVGWNVTRVSTRVEFRDPATGRVLIFDQRDDPQPDPVKDWERQEAYRVARGDFPGYERISIAAVDYFIKCADWEFRYNTSGGRVHVINRGFITSPTQAYGIYWQTPDSTWQQNRQYFDLIAATFKPAPGS